MHRESSKVRASRAHQSVRNRGFVLVLMAAAAIVLMGALGLVVDCGRMFIAKNETQTFCDSAALAAALALDGTTTGITNAQNAVTNSKNHWNLDNATVINPTVAFGTTSAGPWVANPNPATGYLYTQVSTNVSLPLYFLPSVVAKTTTGITSSAVAGQVALTSFPQGLAPYTAVSVTNTGPNFGFTVGQSYDIQWPQYNSTRNGCDANNPGKCFNSSPCAGDSAAVQWAVASNWGANVNGYWGSTSNNTIEQEILDLIQLQAVSVGTNLWPVMSNGNKSSEANYLDARSNEDINSTDNTVSNYLADASNGRRLIQVPVVDPTGATTTTVIGYAEFLLYTNGSPSNYYAKTTNGNDPFCAMYVGPYLLGGSNPGAGGSTGATQVKLIQ